jgi:tRNA-2-methylthio-N6-dimethylallyladenosine synthase
MGGRYKLRVFGCQMNQHDAEKIANLLHHEHYRSTTSTDAADLILVHTCSVRDKAEQKLYSELGALSDLKRARPDLVIGVGGCVAQQEGGGLLRRFPSLDFVFGSQNLRHLPGMVRAARERRRSLRVDFEADAQARFELPERHPEFAGSTPGRAFVTVMEGCDLFCSFCVVPTTRGREVSRPSADILAEVCAHAARGAREITLLGQTVNAYGRARPGRVRGEISFSELIRCVGAVPGIERVRFTSPHPLFVTDDLIEAYGSVPELCPHLHLPAQSGSSRLLRAMNRRYDREQYLSIVERLRTVRPDLAITTDLIVGFPGETDEDFEQTLSLCREVGFSDSFSFKYSPRPGTPAVRRGLQPLPGELAQERLLELQALQRELTLRLHQSRIGTLTRVLVEGPSRRGQPVGQRTGRCPFNRVVNFLPGNPSSPGRQTGPEHGELVRVRLSGATPHSLLGEIESATAPIVLPLATVESR